MEPRQTTLAEIVLAWAGGIAFLSVTAIWIGIRELRSKDSPNLVLDWLVGAPFT